MTALVALLLMLPTQVPAPLEDAPVIDRPAMVFKAGEVVPFDGVCMTDALAIQTGKRLRAGEAAIQFTEGKSVVETPVIVAAVAVVVAMVAGASAAAFIAGRDSVKH